MSRPVTRPKPSSASIYISIEVYEQVKELADREDRPIANMVKVLLKDALRTWKIRDGTWRPEKDAP